MSKRSLAFILISFMGFPDLMAQSNAADSLYAILRLHQPNDTVKVDLLNKAAYEYRRNKPAVTDSLLTVSLSLADKLNYSRGKGYALALMGNRYYLLLKYQQADSAFMLSKQLLEKARDNEHLAYLYRAWANMKMDEGNYSESLDHFLAGLKKANDAGDIKQVVEIERTIGYLYNIIGDYQKAIPYQTDALKHALSINYKTGISGAYNAIGKTYKTQGNYPASLEAYLKGLRVDEEIGDSANIFVSYSNIGDVYERMGRYNEAFSYLRPAWTYYKRQPKNSMVPWDEWVMGKAHTHSGNADSGHYYAKHSLQLANEVGYRTYLVEMTYLIAESAAKLNKWDTAYKYLKLSTAYKDTLNGQEIARKTTMLQASYELDKKQAEIALLTKDKQLQIEENRREKAFLIALLGGISSLIVFAVVLYRNNRQKQKANQLLQQQKEEIDSKASNVELLGEIGRKITSSLSVETIISTVYDNVNALMDASVFGIGIYHDESKTLEFPATYESGQALPAYSNSVSDPNKFATLCFSRTQEFVIGNLQQEYRDYMQHIPKASTGKLPASLIYLPLKAKDSVLGVITVQSFHQNAYSEYHLYMLRNIAIYATIALENAESYKKLNHTVESLKQTQNQLVQAEKMASLGELTAGIAHEIQNPLNFVNNFSEVNKELLAELKDEMSKGNLEEVNAIANDVISNEEKINFHGKRADAIVKGMLQHSRSSSGQKEPTDINALCDEYLRLAYHGLRAKDNSFNASFKTEFDPGIGAINIVPQDMGRVLLNLINNAFYAVNERRQLEPGAYEPTVTITTRKLEKGIEISVKDNGSGIPEKIREKIFQPFFTTKPSGAGTGLGLSLSYEIISKGHSGDLSVQSQEGVGTEFIIKLPSDRTNP